MYTESKKPVDKLITPREATTFLELNNFPGQKRYNQLKGKYYSENMANGSQRRIEISIARLMDSGDEFLMNGQHNLQAVIIYGKPYPASIAYFDCDNIEDAWRLFATFDVHSTRTERQFMWARRGLFTDERLHEVPLRVLQASGSALYYLGDKGTKPNFYIPSVHKKTDKADMVDKCAGEVMFVSQFKEYEHLMSIGVITAIISTHRVKQKESFDFWYGVGTGAEMKLSDHRRKLRDQLLSQKFLGGTLGGGTRRQRATYQLCATWWNSWRKGDERRSVKINSMNGIPDIEG
jgi:hypothetical protein